MSKITLSDAEVVERLFRELQNLDHLERTYDSGHPFIATTIATALCIITVTRNKDISLLRQLAIDDKTYLFTSKNAKVKPTNLLPENNLITIRTSEAMDYVPKLNDASFPFDVRISVKEWCREQVIKSFEGEKWSRQQILLAVRNMEGAHSDRVVSESFKRLKYANPFGVLMLKGTPDAHEPYAPPPYSAIYAAVRHMAFEIQKALREQLTFLSPHELIASVK